MTPGVALQYVLPQRALSGLVRRATRWTWRPWKDFLIGSVARAYAVDLTDAAQPDPRGFPSFNAFFTRALRPGARPPAGDATTITCPADGRISAAGRIDAGRILQAKGRSYTVAELLADEAVAAAYRGGAYVTVYLSPRDYHRVHMPLAGRLVATAHVPGRLFSVAPGPVAGIPRLFARNERLACHFTGPDGPFVVVLVGAMLVSGITTVWDGPVVPPYARGITRQDWRDAGIELARGTELGRFEMGSTVILLLPDATLVAGLQPELPVRVGQALGHLSASSDPVTISAPQDQDGPA